MDLDAHELRILSEMAEDCHTVIDKHHFLLPNQGFCCQIVEDIVK